VKPDPATRVVYEQAGRELESRLNEALANPFVKG
jgi:hypothetical protein